ncbi:hypothetical protein COCON_G00171990 [Conger conger]|uniref:Serine/arginine-rich splicing factor 9 n=1 Tax=Conger conger TaxID=82655 RepID=A0A9Q1D808_CONCO|nr:hypothetical protein COCON_G00171990 [Conger conger]
MFRHPTPLCVIVRFLLQLADVVWENVHVGLSWTAVSFLALGSVRGGVTGWTRAAGKAVKDTTSCSGGSKKQAKRRGHRKYTQEQTQGRSTDGPMADGRIYVGNLPADVQERDLEDLFFKYGKIRDIELKNNRGTIPFAFVRFEDPRDAEDAVYGRNGYGFGDCKLRVEYPRSSSKFSGPAGGPRGRFGPPSRRSEFRVIVTGLPPTGSWQDLKDHMREAGDVCFADVQRDGEGVVEFLRREDMEYALRRLDRTEFRSHQGETAYIRVLQERGSSWGRSRSRSRSRSRGRYSPPYQSRASPPPRAPALKFCGAWEWLLKAYNTVSSESSVLFCSGARMRGTERRQPARGTGSRGEVVTVPEVAVTPVSR